MKIPPIKLGLPGPPRKRSECAFTILELIVVIGIMAFLAVVLVGVGQSARQRSSRATCVGNLKQISVASAAYSMDNQGRWPENEVTTTSTGNQIFLESLLPYFQRIPKRTESDFLKSPFICPGERSDTPDNQYSYQGIYLVRSRGLSYGQNGNLHDTTAKRRVGLVRNSVEYPAELVLYMDFPGHYVMTDARLHEAGKDRLVRLRERHGGIANAAFADGSVRPVVISEIPSEVPSRFWQGRDR